MSPKNKILLKNIFFWIILFLLYCLITAVIFYHRIPHITTQYGMPDIDTDGGLWYQWFTIYSHQHGLMPELTNLIAFPFGIDLTYNPFPNLIYTVHTFILENIIGFSWQHLILVTNLSSLSTYPFAALTAAILGYYVTRNKLGSFLTGLVFSFSFYHLLSGRGEMSVNHIELIPVYLLSLLYYLDRRDKFSLILSGTAYGILFNSDAYYAFFSGIFSIILIFLYRQGTWKEKITQIAIYYPTILLFLILLNFNFVLSNIFLLNHAAAVATGRNSIARSELTTILYYFSAVEGNILTKIPPFGDYIFLIIPTIIFVGAIYLKKLRIYITFLACLVLAMLLTTYVPFFYWVNLFYFKYFGVFRSVGRIIMFGDLFIGILLSIVIATFMKSNLFKKVHKFFFYFIYILLFAIIIVRGLTSDITWYRNGDFAKLAAFYQPFKENKSIKVVATYPMELNGVLLCPQPYNEVGQIIMEKQLTCGASPFDEAAQEHYQNIKDITKESTIDYLMKYHVDTIFIYNNIQPDSKKINLSLQKNPRLHYLGKFVGEWDHLGYYNTANDYSRDVSVYQIPKVVEEENVHIPLFSFQTENITKILPFKKISPYEYTVNIKDITEKGQLLFTSPFSQKWELLLGDKGGYNPLFFLPMKSPFSGNHVRYQDYNNAWIIDKNLLQHIQETKDQTITFYFLPESYYYLGNLMSILTVLGLLIYFSYSLYKKYAKQ